MLKEIIQNDLGKAIIKPEHPVKAATRHTINLIYYPGPRGIEQSGSIRITIPHPLPTPQIHEFYKDNFVTVSCSRNNVSLSLHLELNIFCAYQPKLSHSGAFGKSIFVNVKDGFLKEGDFIKVTYGDISYYGEESWGPKPPKMPELSGRYEFTVAVDPDGQREAPLTGYFRLENSPVLEVIPQKITTIFPITSTLIDKEQENISLKVLMLDHYQNPVEKKSKKMNIKLANNHNVYHKFKNFEIKYRPINEHFFYYYVVYNNGKNEFKTTTNPSKYGKYMDRYQLFWGDLHAHTAYSDGMRSPKEALEYARDIAGLDFTAITDHDDIGPYLSKAEWEIIKKQICHFNKPTQFITFLGYEYRSLSDMNVYYPDNEGRVLCGKREEYQNPKNLNHEIKERKGMIIPHMHFGADWRGYDPEIYRVMEIYSQHGNAEYLGCLRQIPYLNSQLQKGNNKNKNSTFQEILAMGMKMGVTAGSDTHSGRPGFSNWTRVTRTHHGGLTAVFALEKTRKAIWDAVYRRHCYATTGARMYLEFYINGFPMGSEIKAKNREIYINIVGTASPMHIAIIKNNQIFFQIQTTQLHYCHMIEDERGAEEDYYYLRIRQRNGEMAWSSPIWVN